MFRILPTRLKIFVPEFPLVPTLANSAGPFSRTTGTLAQVSTLLIAVGLPSIPRETGYGGRCRGSPIFPSIERTRAVSSPHTNAPAPRTRSTSKENPLPRMSVPSRPSCRAWRSAIVRCLIASGYSVRT